MEHHQRNPGGNATILRRAASYFRFPFDFSDFVSVSQLLQAEARRTSGPARSDSAPGDRG
ncbi:hypothetical protein BRC74_04140 [Halobacteriales archaeon QH_7_68_42]|nr:MAG: hypothetical protein BRC74_04140 [Halobacteriales archaeon QH_7_68_42]